MIIAMLIAQLFCYSEAIAIANSLLYCYSRFAIAASVAIVVHCTAISKAIATIAYLKSTCLSSSKMPIKLKLTDTTVIAGLQLRLFYSLIADL